MRFLQRDLRKQIRKIVVKRNTQNTITKTHTHTNLKAAAFGFRTKKKGQAYNASIQSRKSQRLYNHAMSNPPWAFDSRGSRQGQASLTLTRCSRKHPLTQPPVIPAGKRIALSNALIAPGMEFYSARVSLYQQRGIRRYYNDYTRTERAGYITRNRIRDEKGLLREMEYTVYSSSKLNDSFGNNPITETQHRIIQHWIFQRRENQCNKI